jgi:hypothetical protein
MKPLDVDHNIRIEKLYKRDAQVESNRIFIGVVVLVRFVLLIFIVSTATGTKSEGNAFKRESEARASTSRSTRCLGSLMSFQNYTIGFTNLLEFCSGCLVARIFVRMGT